MRMINTLNNMVENNSVIPYFQGIRNNVTGKIDMSIVRKIASNEVSQKVVENIFFLGNQLHARLIAEGVET